MNIKSILVVDDNDGDRLLAKLAIEDTNITDNIFFSEDGKAALDFLKDFDNNRSKEGENFPPTIILLDINMPNMNGFEFLAEYEKLKADPRYHSVVVMMLTSSLNEKDIEESKTYSSVQTWINKPLTEEKLRHIIANIAKYSST